MPDTQTQKCHKCFIFKHNLVNVNKLSFFIEKYIKNENLKIKAHRLFFTIFSSAFIASEYYSILKYSIFIFRWNRMYQLVNLKYPDQQTEGKVYPTTAFGLP